MIRFAMPLLAVLMLLNVGVAQDEAAKSEPKKTSKPVPLNKPGTILLDAANKKVILKTQVVLRDGFLEMFLCRKHTKEHESILAIDGRAFDIHTGCWRSAPNPDIPCSIKMKNTLRPAGRS